MTYSEKPSTKNSFSSNNNLSSYIASYHNNNNNNKTIGTRVDSFLYDELFFVNKRNGITFQTWLNDQILEYLKKHVLPMQNNTLEKYADENYLPAPDFFSSISTWRNYLQKTSMEECKKWASQLEGLLQLERKIWEIK